MKYLLIILACALSSSVDAQCRPQCPRPSAPVVVDPNEHSVLVEGCVFRRVCPAPRPEPVAPPPLNVDPPPVVVDVDVEPEDEGLGVGAKFLLALVGASVFFIVAIYTAVLYVRAVDENEE